MSAIHNTKKWRRTRERVLKRDNYTCQGCGVTLKELAEHYQRDQRLLIVHHIKYTEDVHDERYLATLCYNCHYYSAMPWDAIYKKLREKIA